MANKRAHSNILVYRLVTPDSIAARVDVIAAALFGMKSAVDSGRSLTVSPLPALLLFSDADRLFLARSPAGLPRDSDTAQRVAERFIADSRKRLAQAGEGLAALLPPLVHESTRAVRAPRSGFPDHWVCIFSTRVMSGVGPPLPVMNGLFEIRVGAEGRIVGLTSTWRPLAEAVRSMYIPPPKEASDAALVYRIEGSLAPQRFLSPYYVRVHDDDGRLWPASGHSLVIDMIAEQTGADIQLRALPSGGSDSYRFAWAMWHLTSPNTFTALGTDSRVRIPLGTAANVIVDVEDTKTGAIVRAERLLFASFGQVVSRA